MKLEFKCPRCNKKATVTRESILGNKKFSLLTCGHIDITEKPLVSNEINPVLKDGRLLYEFQKAGVEFIKDSDFRCLIADEMGLGKTIQVVSAFQNFGEVLLPALVIVKASLKIQWVRELFNGARLISQVLESKTIPVVNDPKLKVSAYIASYDSLAGATWKDKIPYKSLILDECQMIKNHNSKRTQQVRDLARDKSFIIMTSGTPIKNNAGEYFPALNLLKPEVFPEQSHFIANYTNSYRTSYGWKVGGIRNPSWFKEFTKSYIIRRNRKEVLPDLPEIRRSYRYTSFSEEIGKKYKAAALDLQDYLMNKDEESEGYSEHILAKMNRLRHLSGYGKIDTVIDYIEEFLENEPDEKITVFHHHQDIGELLVIKLNDMGARPLQLKSEHDYGKRSDIIDEFRNSSSRILIAPTLACGEGINLQFCSHAVILEREWNPANEEQAEGRFSRIGSNADSIECVYPVAIGSIDELFAEYVEKKRQYVTETLSGIQGSTWNQSDIIKELSKRMLSGETKRFSL